MTGLFIVFEGGEGSGKTTQVNRLHHFLSDAALIGPGRRVIKTRQPGGTDVGQTIRRLLLDGKPGSISDRAEALLYAADRAQHVDEVVRPALDAGHIVVSDRYVDSSIAYQGAGRAMSAAWIETLSEWATGRLEPDLTIVLDVDPLIGLARAARRGFVDRLEAETVDFHHRVRDTFLELAKADPARYLVLDATVPARELADTIVLHVYPLVTALTGAVA